MTQIIPGKIGVNVEKVCGLWVVEMYFPGVYTPWVQISRNKSKSKALKIAMKKIMRLHIKLCMEAVKDDRLH
jgi:hypothetical protein